MQKIFFSAPSDRPNHLEVIPLIDSAGEVFTSNNQEAFSPFTGEKASVLGKNSVPAKLDFALAYNMVRVGHCASCKNDQLAHFNDAANLVEEHTNTLHCVSCGEKYNVNISAVDMLSADSEIEAKEAVMSDTAKAKKDEVLSEFDKDILQDETESDIEDVTDGDAEALLESDVDEDEEIDEDLEEDTDSEESDSDETDEESEEDDDDSEDEDEEDLDDIDEEDEAAMDEILASLNSDEFENDEASEDVTFEFDVASDEEELITETMPLDEAAVKEAVEVLGNTDKSTDENTAVSESNVAEPVVENAPVPAETKDEATVEETVTPPAKIEVLASNNPEGENLTEVRVDKDIARADASIECLLNANSSRYYVTVNGNPVGYCSRDEAHADNAAVFDTAGFVKGFTLQYRNNRDLSRFGFIPYVVRTDISKIVEAEYARKNKEIVDTASADSAKRLDDICNNLGVVTLASVKGLLPCPLRDRLVATLDAAGFEGAAGLVNKVLADTAAEHFKGIMEEATKLSVKSPEAQAIFKETVEKINYTVTTTNADIAHLVKGGRHVPPTENVTVKDTTSTRKKSENQFADFGNFFR